MTNESNTELKNILEAALLVAGQVLSIKKLAGLFPEDARPSAEDIRAALMELQADCAGRGIELVEVGKGFRFQSRQRYAEWVARLSEERPARYSRALLETLAIIAYRQPVTRGDIEEIRGVAVSSDIMNKLSERSWVREVGHRDVPGRPALFGTTPEFLEHFGLKSLSELPPLSELRDLEEIGRELNLSLDLGEDTPGNSDDGDDDGDAGGPALAAGDDASADDAIEDRVGDPDSDSLEAGERAVVVGMQASADGDPE